MDPKPVSRRRLLLSSAATLGSGMVFTRLGSAAPLDIPDASDLVADILDRQGPLLESILSDLRKRKAGVARPPNPVALRRDRRNPYFGPIGQPLDAAEQSRNKPGPAAGRGL